MPARFGLLMMVAAVALCLSACAPQRPPATAAELEQRQQQATLNYHQQLHRICDGLLLRAETLSAEQGDHTTLDILILSSGGYWGAFGAGFMNAWAQRDHESMPEFALVSGMSTGAFMAPFALALDPSHPQLVEHHYRSCADDWLKQPLHGILPWRSSLLNHQGLDEAVRAVYDHELQQHLAQAAADNRQVIVATADLDLGRQSLWSLGELAASEGSPDKLQDILLAATAIPGLISPVELDGSLHADGNTMETIIAGTEPWVFKQLVYRWQEKHGQRPLPAIRVWVVVNGKQRIEQATTQPNWPDITKRAVGAVGKAGLVNGLRSLSLTAEILELRYGVDMQLRWICVPEDFALPEDLDALDPRLTHLLADLGRELASQPEIPWFEEAPGITSIDLGNGFTPLADHDQDLHDQGNKVP